ncbi:ATP-binding protein [Desulfofalx alkaliphila]|uniref:ATP-binding protein n=1 Tax=Desulfofalx alkaliphila TaxID=105483 RepID=UPI0004E0B240|nr:ATP-binding protein [Desulfofalx alkaliphila]
MAECELCGGRGLIIKKGVATRCPCMKKKAFKAVYRRSGLTPLMQQCTFENFNFQYYAEDKFDEVKGYSYAQTARLTYNAAKEFTERFLKDPHTEGLMFTGPVGSGKTYLACCIANEVIQKGSRALFVVVPDWLDQIRSTYSPQGAREVNEQTLIDEAREVPLLILDDLGVHNYTQWTVNKLYSLINYRLNHCLATIVTTNLTALELSEHLGERTTSRLFQICKAYRLLVDKNIRYVNYLRTP